MKVNKNIFLLICAFLLLIFASYPANSQSLSNIEELRDRIPNYYSFVRIGEPSIEIMILGSVKRAGTYKVRENVRLNELILFAGGPEGIGNITRGKRAKSYIMVSRKMEDRREIIFETEFRETIVGELNFPIMEYGDIVIVEREAPRIITWRDVLTITAQGLSIISSTLIILWRLGYLDRR